MMFKVIGGVVVYGFAAFGLVKFLGRIRFKEPAPAQSN